MHDRRHRTVRDLRRGNRAAVLWSLYFDRPCSRQDLSAATGLSPASVTNVVRELLAEGIVAEAGSQDSDGGRPRVLLDVRPEYGFVVGADVGETRVRVGLYDLALTEHAKAEYPLDPAEQRVDVVVRAIADGLRAVLADAGVSPTQVLGVGVGVPGIVEQGREALVHGQTYGWDAVPMERLLRAHTDLPLRFENCAKTMGQAELWFGAGRGARNAAVVLIGSGVGAALISGGSMYLGTTSSAGEWGHTTIVAGGRRCRCGSDGCLEAYVGAEAILDRFGAAEASGFGTSGSGTPATGTEEAALATLVATAGSSPAATALLTQTAYYLGIGIANLINLFNPERVILGGWAGLLLGDRLLVAIRESAGRHSLRRPFAAASIELGELGPEAVTLGAATLPLAHFLDGAARRQTS
ncbi:MAG TPA: ROK family transcriptional regulator [Actinocrinis sp.]|uniref:ROK family transcriptional regulator n=1 Tax=Actinocrinis sp. TaxID=1920516 RepID=UPI002DDCDDC8|nr:ROK family transcriptional regulator [Actinocrinis sp.]HEV2344262.1 ROK family transcriptional regulator [Actinocrinis sp.]